MEIPYTKIEPGRGLPELVFRRERVVEAGIDRLSDAIQSAWSSRQSSALQRTGPRAWRAHVRGRWWLYDADVEIAVTPTGQLELTLRARPEVRKEALFVAMLASLVLIPVATRWRVRSEARIEALVDRIEGLLSAAVAEVQPVTYR